MPTLKPLLLAGGHSSRMGTRKELLRVVGDVPLFVHLLIILREASPESDVVFLSLHDHDSLKAIANDRHITAVAHNQLILNRGTTTFPVHVVYDGPGVPSEHDSTGGIGPAAGLLAAHHQDEAASWLVVACDYPFISVAALAQLRGEWTAPVTCFENRDGFCEPLLSIWSPDALRALKENIRNGILGPSAVVRRLRGKMIRPHEERWIFNVNTPADLEVASSHMKTKPQVSP
ncbi:molybdenum cofactor guanylyltransferase [Aspergillus novofumigatus IBT 16806]|uniref:Nucleotide-diphospho-sugar transferase n=1 Tax=Aspergillus novofumigatus (strain IBT 16806) TaxID=1392255 RepID=A0A2I1BTD1_ASPN1|nr:nucleotide-diphospho-sugar transferase [Aspergillus novofumigatus IBT 16806]PKX88658.1 nucleotide-diphospho-sugar transferase [Aspergillus novofumigatus IBT 16806]